jgi:hypothetical protein
LQFQPQAALKPQEILDVNVHLDLKELVYFNLQRYETGTEEKLREFSSWNWKQLFVACCKDASVAASRDAQAKQAAAAEAQKQMEARSPRFHFHNTCHDMS